MPNVWVFPGGSVDRGDADARALGELRPGVRRALEHESSPRRARALAVAALRETYEETGLCFGRVEDGQLLPELSCVRYLARAITPARSPIRYHARFFCAEQADAHGELVGNGELLELAWFGIEEALTLRIIDVTAFVLRQVMQDARCDDPKVPLYCYRAGKPRVIRGRMPST